MSRPQFPCLIALGISLLLTFASSRAFAQGTPTAYWKLDETSGTTAADSSGNNHPATLVNGPTFTTGKINNGLSLDGTDDYVDLGNLGLSAGTLSLWAKPTSVSGDRRLLDQLSGATTQGGALGFDPS